MRGIDGVEEVGLVPAVITVIDCTTLEWPDESETRASNKSFTTNFVFFLSFLLPFPSFIAARPTLFD